MICFPRKLHNFMTKRDYDALHSSKYDVLFHKNQEVF